MMGAQPDNPLPEVKQPKPAVKPETKSATTGISSGDVYDIIKNIRDPEHPHSLEELNVLEEDNVRVSDDIDGMRVFVQFTPTVPHCSLVMMIGLCIRVKLETELPTFKLELLVTPGSHQAEKDVNKQINDKERVAAAKENAMLRGMVNNLIKDESY